MMCEHDSVILFVTDEYLDQCGLESTDCGGGGNCYGRVIAFAMFKDSTRHLEVRLAGVQFIRDNFTDYLLHFPGENAIMMKHHLEVYLEGQSKEDTWMHGPILTACLKAYGLVGVTHMMANSVGVTGGGVHRPGGRARKRDRARGEAREEIIKSG